MSLSENKNRINCYESCLGFTLIETMMVLAIGSLLAILLFTTFRQTRQRAEFTDAIERVVTNLEAAKTEANSSYTTGVGTTASRAFFAKAVQFSTGSGTITNVTLTADRYESGNTITGVDDEDNPTVVTLPWGVYCSSASCSTAVVFSRDLGSGILNTYIVPGDIKNVINYPAGSGNDTSTLDLTFTSPTGKTAVVSINAQTNEIKRSYTN